LDISDQSGYGSISEMKTAFEIDRISVSALVDDDPNPVVKENEKKDESDDETEKDDD
jgi:hypothetical protein